MTTVFQLAWAARSHTGHRRARNEDSILARAGLFAVADGMGGHAAGDLASQWTVQALADAADAGTLTRLSVVDAVRAADDRLRRFAHHERNGIGTTICALVVTSMPGHEQRLGLLNVGDSRAYRLRDGGLTQLTRDHSVVQELIDEGAITAAEAVHHPERHVVTRSLGAEEHLEIDWWALDAITGDRYLVCSDGLTKEVTDEGIRRVLMTEPDVARAADALIGAALRGGGRDNVSVIIVDVVLVDPEVSVFAAPDPLDGDTTPRALHGVDHALDADTEPTVHLR